MQNFATSYKKVSQVKRKGYILFNIQVESGAAVAKTSIYDMCIPKQPDPSEIPQLKSELETHVTYTYVIM